MHLYSLLVLCNMKIKTEKNYYFLIIIGLHKHMKFIIWISSIYCLIYLVQSNNP